MDKRIRYSLIIAGFIFFLIAAPLIVFFARGIKFDFEEKKFVPTGIFAVKSDPDGADILLDGKLVMTGSGEIRFLKPKDYLVAIKKPGYYPWEKTVSVEAGKVAWANPGLNKVYLLLMDKNREELFGGIVDFEAWDSGLAALAKNEIIIADGPNFTSVKRIPLPKEASGLLSSPDFTRFLLTKEADGAQDASVLLFDRQTESVSEIKNLFVSRTKLPAFGFSGDGRLFAEENSSLYEINPQGGTKTLVASAVIAWTIHNQTLYYLTQNKTGVSRLLSLDLNAGAKQTLSTNLPAFTSATIIVNSQKRIFLAADNTLYAFASDGLVKLADGLENWEYKKAQDALVFLASGELRYLDAAGQNLLITRVSENLQSPVIMEQIGYAFFIKNNTLTALELDRMAPQNSYPVYEGKSLQKFFLSRDGKYALVLDAGELNKVIVR